MALGAPSGKLDIKSLLAGINPEFGIDFKDYLIDQNQIHIYVQDGVVVIIADERKQYAEALKCLPASMYAMLFRALRELDEEGEDIQDFKVVVIVSDERDIAGTMAHYKKIAAACNVPIDGRIKLWQLNVPVDRALEMVKADPDLIVERIRVVNPENPTDPEAQKVMDDINAALALKSQK